MPCTIATPCVNVLRFIARRPDGAELHECGNGHSFLTAVPPDVRSVPDPATMCGWCDKLPRGQRCAWHDPKRTVKRCPWCARANAGRCERHGGLSLSARKAREKQRLLAKNRRARGRR